MNIRNPRNSLLILAVLGLSAAHSFGSDPMTVFYKKLGEAQERKENNIKGPRLADELFALPDWRNQMAEYIVDLLHEARYDGPHQERETEFGKLQASDPTMQKPETKAAYLEYMKEQMAVQKGDGVKVKLARAFNALASMKDPRVVPLIAPALNENGIGTHHGDYVISPPQYTAAETLSRLATQKVIAIEKPKDAIDIAGWRGWWKDNRLEFDQVPEALRAIDEGRDTKPIPRHANGMLMAPNAEQRAAIKVQQEAYRAANPEPEKPATTTPATVAHTVAPSRDMSLELTVGAAVCAILLAAGIWFYGRSARHV